MIEMPKELTASQRRWAGLLLALFFGMLGALARFQFGWPNVALGLWIAGGALGALYYLAPPLQTPIYLGWMWAVFPIGWTISHLILGVLFYLVITPVGLLMRLFGRNPLARNIDRKAATYWIRRSGPPASERYFRQF